MFKFKLEKELELLTVTRKGFWSVETVNAYEAELRVELKKLRASAKSPSFIIDIRGSGAQAREVAEALRAMVARLGVLNADKTAVVTASGLAKLQARRVADANARVFTSMVLARDWILGAANTEQPKITVHDEPSEAEAQGATVHIHGPNNADIVLTPVAALETAKRIGNAAVEVLLSNAEKGSSETV